MVNQKQIEVVRAAEKVFLLHGYARTTMGDIAKSARISRPALYLIFQSKEEIFRASVTDLFATKMARLKESLSADKTVREHLLHAFDIWYVETYELVRSYPEAKDLFESSLMYAADITDRANDDFREVLVHIMKSCSANKIDAAGDGALSLSDIARLMIGASTGFKAVAKDKSELTALLCNQVTLVLAILNR